MQSMDFDRCIKSVGAPGIWMVRESTKSRVRFQTWEDYEAAGTPVYEVVTEEALAKYRVAKQFRPLIRV